MTARLARALAVVTLAAAYAACYGRDGTPAAAVQVDLTGAGATFPFPVIRDWIAEYASREGVRVNYMSVGSAEGLRLVAAGDVDFGTSDFEPTQSARGGAACGPVSVPILVGAIAVVYHLPGLGDGVRLNRSTLKEIFDGRIRQWNAPAIARLNPAVRLPPMPITVVYRGAGSATGRLFAHFLSGNDGLADTVSADPVWRVGIAAEGNEGVAVQVQQTVGAIGYTELAYAAPNGLSLALIENAMGEYARPSAATINATVAAAFRGRTDAHGTSLISLREPGTYPLAAITWLTLDPARLGPDRGRQVRAFAQWAMRDGAAAARRLEAAPLPSNVVAHYDSLLSALSFAPCPAA
ncbi:MAG: phosphate ABC transporter substrate-binding protein PstS [Gemmatimonadota bacterium]|nr:phosphate ABC transporter substrate-binding protein PstS [Gemmatimonadota bacterium]